MPDLSQLLGPWGTFLIFGLSVISGAAGSFVSYLIQKREVTADARQSLNSDLREQVGTLRDEVKDLRERFVEERQARVRAQFQAFALRKKLDLVISMLNEMRRKMDMSEITNADLPGNVPTEEDLRDSMEDLGTGDVG
jgi:hypothetical protein